MPFELAAVIISVGYIGLFIIIYAETGLLIGFFLPGDSLLITTGLLAERGHFEVWILIPLLSVAAIAGDATGYQIGAHAGPRLFTRDDSRFFKRSHLERAEAFYEKHGGKTIVLARFLAFVRTFAPTVAGAAQMPYPKFALYNITGGITWIVSMIGVGYVFGHAVPNLDAFFIVLIGGIIAISLAPAAWHLWRERRRTAAPGN